MQTLWHLSLTHVSFTNRSIRQLFPIILLLLAAQTASAQPPGDPQLLDTVIDVGSGKLHFRILKGNRSPVLFESGGGLDGSQWDSIATVVHERLGATVISYDRAGFGKSSPHTENLTILEEIQNLEAALEKLGYRDAGFLLVGHSLGGFYSRVFAARHPSQVKGIVLLDPRIPSLRDMRFARNYFQTLDRSQFDPGYLDLYRLLGHIERMSEYVMGTPLPDSIPVLDMMAQRGPFTQKGHNRRFKADQRRLVKGHRNRRLLMAKGSSHNIAYDKPGLVISQIMAFYKEHLL